MNLRLHPTILAGALCFFLTLIQFVMYLPVFTTPTDMDTYAQKYANSQYIKGDASPLKITDGELYVYAGYAYIRGEDPTTINFEHPPLVKYLFGLSYLVFGNSFIVSLILYGVFLWTFYLFTGLVISRQSLRYISVIILGLQPVVYILASQALLDTALNILVLLLFYVLFAVGVGKTDSNSPKRRKKSLILKYGVIGIVLGLLSSVKYPFPFMLLPFALVGVVSFIKKEMWHLPAAMIIAPLVYLAQYAVYFAHGHSLLDFIAFEKYRLSWWIGDRTMPKFLIFQNLFTGQFPAWWEENLVIKSQEWNAFLPVLFLTHVVAMSAALIKKLQFKNNFAFVAICAYSVILISVYGFGAAVYLRYLTQLVPFWIVVIVAVVERMMLTADKK